MGQGSKRVLIIDDDNDVRKSLTVCLTAAGFEVGSARDGDQGLRAIGVFCPDIIILDIVMPRRDGWEVIRRIREDPATNGLPVVMLTQVSDEGSKVLAFRTGADDYIEKPFHVLELIARVERLLEKQGPVDPPGAAGGAQAGHPMEKIPVRKSDRVTFIPVEDICYIRASGKYSFVHTIDGKYLTDYSLKEIEEEVRPQGRLFRIHRSWLVNLDRVSKVSKESPGRYMVEMEDDGGTVLCVSQRRTRGFKEALHLHL